MHTPVLAWRQLLHAREDRNKYGLMMVDHHLN